MLVGHRSEGESRDTRHLPLSERPSEDQQRGRPHDTTWSVSPLPQSRGAARRHKTHAYNEVAISYISPAQLGINHKMTSPAHEIRGGALDLNCYPVTPKMNRASFNCPEATAPSAVPQFSRSRPLHVSHQTIAMLLRFGSFFFRNIAPSSPRHKNSASPKHHGCDNKHGHDCTSDEQHLISIHRNLPRPESQLLFCYPRVDIPPEPM